MGFNIGDGCGVDTCIFIGVDQQFSLCPGVGRSEGGGVSTMVHIATLNQRINFVPLRFSQAERF